MLPLLYLVVLLALRHRAHARLTGLELVAGLLLLNAASRAAAAAAVRREDEEAFIGWRGETFSTSPAHTAAAVPFADVQVLSWQPRVMLHTNFLTPEECDHLVAKALPRLKPSVVIDPDTATPRFSEIRTSTGMFFNRSEDATIDRVEARMAAWTMLPQENTEGIQILHYETGEQYRPHHDYFYNPSHVLNGGNRVATVILYLSDVAEGGETTFVDVPPAPHQTAAAGWTACGREGLGVRPRKGSALLFWSLRPDGAFDTLTRHQSCPVVAGTKIVGTRWIHETEYDVTPVRFHTPHGADDALHRSDGGAEAAGAVDASRFDAVRVLPVPTSTTVRVVSG